jgi:hypothetical protein
MMDSLDRSPDDSPLCIASMFRRQAAALGIIDSPSQLLAPFASIVASSSGDSAFIASKPVQNAQISLQVDQVTKQGL